MRLDDCTLYKNGLYPYFAVVFSIITILNILSILYYFFNLYVTFRVKHFKTNIQILHQAIYATCPFSSVFIIIDGVANILGKRDFNLPFALNFFRVMMSCPREFNCSFGFSSLPFSALFALVAIMLERIFATYYIKDYERERRPLVGYSIILLLIVMSICTAFIFSYPELVIVFVVCHLSLNVICYVVSLITYRINRKYYYNNRERKHSYSLGERYQISENIRLYKFFSHYLFVLAVFPISCTIFALIDHIDSNPIHREILAILFDLSYTLLCFLAPFLTNKMSEPWQTELDIIYMKLGIKKPNKIHTIRDSSKILRGTFGEEINVETSKHTDVYFNQLKSSWNQNNGLAT
ncbi:CRE-SRE-18 protein [Caenorhabditis remanei]|uniref:CRE-SRE-18 protein n=1 Tax=Caenorhabditis remanei TaxID=31234 RepID=E3MSZ7_CAERE|nr:CRE-SRE-18 protein [Caenorhabditis remanei]